MLSPSIPVMSGTGKQSKGRTGSFTLDDISEPVQSGLAFEKEEPPSFTTEEEELQTQLENVGEARRWPSRDSNVR